jgi:nitronate monooxygenase
MVSSSTIMALMSLRTAFTEMTGVEHPIALAPMGGCSGGALAAAVSNAGGLGLVGGGRASVAWCREQVAFVVGHTERPWGVGFLTWALSLPALEEILELGPTAVMLSFGDPGPFSSSVRDSGATLIVQVTDRDEARRALDVGADIVVAQGTEAGGHGGQRSTLPFVPAIVDLAAPTPVLAAGGVADGRGLAAALALGAAGALVGTRFQASQEALASKAILEAIVEGNGDDTLRTHVLDIALATSWPARYTGRSVRNPFVDQWQDKEEELASDDKTLADYRAQASRGDPSAQPVWASEAIDLIHDVPPAGDIVREMVRGAEDVIRSLTAATA